jgi:hypothetical protein
MHRLESKGKSHGPSKTCLSKSNNELRKSVSGIQYKTVTVMALTAKPKCFLML